MRANKSEKSVWRGIADSQCAQAKFEEVAISYRLLARAILRHEISFFAHSRLGRRTEDQLHSRERLMTRTANITRQTNETEVELTLNLDGSGISDLDTGVGFLDHMLELFTRHAAVDLRVRAQGDLQVDQHHTVEDVGICLGQALKEAVGDKRGIRRYGHFTLPMDESLVTAAIDLSGRAYLMFAVAFPNSKIGDFDSELVEEFWQAFASNGLCNLHLRLEHGRNSHHISEAVFKSAARALRMAVEPDPRLSGVPSTKGTL